MPEKPNDLSGKVKSFYDIMRDEKVEELKISSDKINIRLKRKGARPVAVPAAAAAVAAPAPAEVVEAGDKEAAVSGETVTSPITGILYRSPSPTSEPFITEGDIVEQGRTLCIVEAMKVMNEIKAEYKLKVLKIFIDNGKTVNTGDVILSVERV
jgi:acetyl-CoA carboxylase biotin carboxyl carrier protein